MQDLDKLYGDEDDATTEVAAEAPETEQTETEVEAEETPKGETPEPEKEPASAEPPAAEESDEVKGIKAALMEERRKRQEWERRYQEREQKEKPETNFWDNPEAVIAQRVSEVEQKFTTRILKQSEAAARQRYEDYDTAILAFQEAIEADPRLYDQMLNADDPAEYAYSVGQTYSFTKDAPTIGELQKKVRSQVEGELREKIRKELEAEYRGKNLSRVPESLTDETGATTKQVQAAGGPTPIENIYDS